MGTGNEEYDNLLVDRIEIKSNYKGEMQGSVKIHGMLANKELIDDCIDRQKYVWVKNDTKNR